MNGRELERIAQSNRNWAKTGLSSRETPTPVRKTKNTPIRDEQPTSRQISDLLSPRAVRVLGELEVQTVGQLGRLNPSRIPPVPGAGRKTIREIVMLQENLFGPYKHPVLETVKYINPDARTADGLEDALIGCTEAGRMDEEKNHLAVYDSDLCVGLIMDRGIIRKNAENHLECILRKLDALGDKTPVFVRRRTPGQTLRELELLNPDVKIVELFEDALMGYTDPAQGRKPVAVYDSELCVRSIMRECDEDEDEDEEYRAQSAVDHLEYNFYGVLINYGENAPVFVRLDDSLDH